ncbi:MAG: sigma-70 family RNA polymerase sigma factor [Planctomyces sp.]|nr:sigma-70 family RNA polymerase sigma factor [Planctomyces sp.]
MSQTPLTLLERFRAPLAGNAPWARLLTLYSPCIERWLRQSGIPAADLPDLEQDVMATLLRELRTFQHSGRPGAFRHWLRKVVQNRAHDYWRRRRRVGTPLQQERAAEVLENLEDSHRLMAAEFEKEHEDFLLRRLLDLIQPDFSATTWRAFYDQAIRGRSAKDVSADLGISPNAALIARSRVLQRLRSEAAGLID